MTKAILQGVNLGLILVAAGCKSEPSPDTPVDTEHHGFFPMNIE
jgi:hypothetical protein